MVFVSFACHSDLVRYWWACGDSILSSAAVEAEARTAVVWYPITSKLVLCGSLIIYSKVISGNGQASGIKFSPLDRHPGLKVPDDSPKYFHYFTHSL